MIHFTIKLTIALLTFASLSTLAGFDDEGHSHNSCAQARKEALFLAKSNCISLGAEDSQKEHFSKCKSRDGKRFVSVSYNCQLPKEDDDGYDPDYSENESSATEI